MRAAISPPGTSRDGQFFSFQNRLLDGFNEWDTHFALRVSHDLRFNAGGGYADVLIQYTDTQGPYGDNIGWTSYFYRGGCATHTDYASGGEVYAATVRMNPRSDWYTAPDRGTWETNCAAWGSYTCSKTQDFQSAFSHELIHAWGLIHPGTVDVHHGGSSTGGAAYNFAECGNIAAARTSCPGGYNYRTAKRTVEPYDTQSLRLSYLTYAGLP
jgi:hypothetical protein